MIANFFQSLEQNRVEYLLISGQATVLYGAATFSEDIDLWIKPAEENRDGFIATLRDCQACYHKLTPPLTVAHLQDGHGFHFRLPDGHAGEIYLDVMGKPPRAGAFDLAAETVRMMDTEWGIIRTIGIKPLVELKKTQRLEDYPIISKLALAWLDQPECPRLAGDYVWALENIFTLPELAAFLTQYPEAIDATSHPIDPDFPAFGRELAEGEVAEAIEHRIGNRLQARISELQTLDRKYWRDIIRRLKELRAKGELMPEGKRVSALD
jgi:hypothetical protein